MTYRDSHQIDMVVAIAISAAAGVALWFADRLLEAALHPLINQAPAWLALAANAGVEELLRLGMALATIRIIHKLDLEMGLATLTVMASCSLAILENASYVAAFPTLDAYWRLGYTLPIHVCAATLYALATAAPRRAVVRMPRRRLVLASLSAAWTWHTAFNIAATYAPFTLVAPVGTILNLAVLAALVVASAIRFGYWSIYATGRF
jgi:hypothetical protein